MSNTEDLADLLENVDGLDYMEAARVIEMDGWRHCVETNESDILDALPKGARILTPKTGEVWWPSRHGHGWDGSGGGYSNTWDLLEHEGPAVILLHASQEGA